MSPDTASANESIDWYVIPRTKKVYLCPRQIHVHRGSPERCGAACRKAQAENDVEYEDEAYLEVVSVRKEIIFDEAVCRTGQLDETDSSEAGSMMVRRLFRTRMI